MPFSVLVADDEPHVRALLVRILEASGYKVVSVADGRAALQSLTDEDFDLIICDQSMPHATGEQVAAVASKNKTEHKSNSVDRQSRSFLQVAFRGTNDSCEAGLRGDAAAGGGAIRELSRRVIALRDGAPSQRGATLPPPFGKR